MKHSSVWWNTAISWNFNPFAWHQLFSSLFFIMNVCVVNYSTALQKWLDRPFTPFSMISYCTDIRLKREALCLSPTRIIIVKWKYSRTHIMKDCVTPQRHFLHFCSDCFKFINSPSTFHVTIKISPLPLKSRVLFLSRRLNVLPSSHSFSPFSWIRVRSILSTAPYWQRHSCSGLLVFFCWLGCRALDQMAAVFIWMLPLNPHNCYLEARG